MTPFIVCLKENNDQIGTAISEHVVTLPVVVKDANGEDTMTTKVTPLVGVLWDDIRSPSPSYHDPSELEWLSIPSMDEEEAADGEISVDSETTTG